MAAWVALQGSLVGSVAAARVASGKPGDSDSNKVALDSKPADSDKPEDSVNNKVALANNKVALANNKAALDSRADSGSKVDSANNKVDSVALPGGEHFPDDSVERESRGEQEFFPTTLANL